jgi:hypothetical protein
MSSLSMMSLIWRITFGGAVMTSALLVGSAQIWEFLLCLGRGVAAPPATAGCVAAAMPDICSLSFGASLVGIGVAQVAHLGIAAGLLRGIQVSDQHLGAQSRPGRR